MSEAVLKWKEQGKYDSLLSKEIAAFQTFDNQSRSV